jgi:hypothetical protein
MNSFDTIRIELELINSIDIKISFDKFISRKNYYENGRESIIYTLRNQFKPIGLSDLTIWFPLNKDKKSEYGNLEIQFSSKILGNECDKLINRQTINKVIHNINSINAIKLDAESFINYGKVLKAHNTFDLKVKNTYAYLQVLKDQEIFSSFGNSMSKWRTTIYIYKDKTDKGVETREVILRIYDKYVEAKRNKQLKQIISPEKFRNVIRFEMEMNNKKKLLKNFAVSKNNIYFNDILQSKIKPVIEQTLKIMDDMKLYYDDQKEYVNHLHEIFNNNDTGIVKTQKMIANEIIWFCCNQDASELKQWVSLREKDRTTANNHYKDILKCRKQFNKIRTDPFELHKKELIGYLKAELNNE